MLYPGRYLLVRYARDSEVVTPHVELDQFVSVTYNPDDIALICPEGAHPEGSTLVSSGWRVLQLKGPYALENVRAVADVSHWLRQAGVSLFVSSAFDTDYLLIQDGDAAKTCDVMREQGFVIEEKSPLGNVCVNA